MARADDASRWRTRTVVVALLAVLAGHALAALGLRYGMPPAPWGDEAHYWRELVVGALRMVWLPWEAPPADAATPAGFARGIVPFILLWLAGEAVVHQLRNPLRLLRIARRGDHAVLLGLSPLARHVLSHWQMARRSTLVVSAQAGDEGSAIAGGAAFVGSDWHVEDMPRRAALGRAASVACVAGTDVENIDAAVSVTRAAERLRPAGIAPLVVFAKVEDPFLRARIDERIDRFASLDRVQVRLFSAAQIAVRRLLREHPLDRFGAAGAAPRPWILGFGTVGEELAVEAIRLSPARGGAPCAISVIDRDATVRRAPFLRRWPGAEEVARLSFLDGGAEDGAALVERLLAAQPEGPSAIYFCHAEEATNLAGALALVEAMRARGLHVPPLYLRGSGAALRAMGEGLAGHPWVHTFGDDASVAGEFLLGERLDAAARAIHESYLAEATQRGEEMGARRSLRPWLLLPEDLKDDNRSLADHHFVKVRAAGCALRPLRDGEAPDPQWTAEEVEALAEFEHERWMTQRLLAGWRHDPKRDDAAKRHPDLVPYGQLGERQRELDRAVIRGIPPRLAGVGYAVVRELAVEVSGPAAPWAFAPSFEASARAALQSLRERAADQSLIVWCGMKSAMACRVGEMVLESGARLGVVLDEPAHACLARQPTDEIRARLFALMRAAERVTVAGEGPPPAARLHVRLSIDGSDLQASPEAWGIDSAGRVLFEPGSRP